MEQELIDMLIVQIHNLENLSDFAANQCVKCPNSECCEWCNLFSLTSDAVNSLQSILENDGDLECD